MARSLSADISILPLANLTEHAITSHIASRYHQGLSFVTISTGALIALNTLSPFDVNQDQIFKDLAARAYNRLCKRGESQSVLFIGESGSGKTEFRDSLVSHLLTLSNNPLSAKIRHADYVVQCFTRTKTLNSLNGSRAGNVLELQYGADATLIGANILDYRLERSRVSKVPTSERNFHVFYYLLAGIAESEREHLALSDFSSSRYRYLGHPTQKIVPGIDNKQRFRQLKTALKGLEFSRADIANICQILAAILHVGQIQFKSTGADGTSNAAIEITNRDVLAHIAEFLGVRPDLLESALSFRTVTINKDRVTLVLDHKGARDNADELARALYALLFSWILERVNSRLSQDKGVALTGLDSLVNYTLSVVDFPGFTQAAAIPDLDKLLHNSANEMLYRYMLSTYMDRPTEKFESEEVSVPSFEYFDNSNTVRTLFRPSLGLLAVIDDYSRRGKDDNALMESLGKRFDKNPSVNTVKSRRSFSVNHFAGEVEYSVDNLLAANSDNISGDIINLFTSSSSSNFLKAMFSSSAVVDTQSGISGTVTAAHLSSKPLRQPSVRRTDSQKNGGTISQDNRKNKKTHRMDASGQFSAAMDKLIESFDNANPYFVICLKPNDHRLASQFDARCVRQQVSAFGIPEIARRVKQSDFSIFMNFHEFILADGRESADSGSSERDTAIHIISSRSWPERDARYGLSGVFLSESAWLQLVDPKMSFAESANQRYIDAGDHGPAYADNDAFYYDQDARSVAGTTGGDMFKFSDSKSLKDAYIRAKPVGESDEDQVDEIPVSRNRKLWMTLVWALTWWIPDFFIKFFGRMPRKDVRVAWREKFAINLLIWLSCGGVILFLLGFPMLICPSQNVLSPAELSGFTTADNPNKVYAALRGYVFDLSKFAPGHYPSVIPTDDILDYGGKDISNLFPIQISSVCKGVNGTVNEAIMLGPTSNYTDSNAQYHDFRSFQNDSRPDWYIEQMMTLKGNFQKAYLGYTPGTITKIASEKRSVIASLNGYVYDLTSYTTGELSLKVKVGQKVPTGVDKYFMSQDVVNLFQSYSGQDISNQWQSLNIDSDVRSNMMECLNNIFLVAKVDTRNSVRCEFARYFLLAISICLVAVIGFKFVAALQFTKRRVPEDLDKFFICQVPAYTEDEDSLRRAIDSLARTKYDDKRKLLVVVCDGMIVGAGNDRPTPRIVLDILGAAPSREPEALSFESLGEGAKQHNMAKVYSGLYEVHGHIVPYIVIVKVGKPTEINRPGNRGKRDSQLVLMRFLNRVHYNLPMNPLELELYHQIQNVIGVNPAYYEYILQVDADTVVAPESAAQMLSYLVYDTKIQAVCGETALSNARSSIVTMMQVYEYYISHNLAKAFESLFGSVTCLPGCFSMYRIYQSGTGKPVFISHPIVKGYEENRVDTLHMKNLLHLGEDRYLTTLLLKHNPKFKTKFIREAQAWTIAPDSWKVFVSQRRRWINSTVHNLIELVPLSQLCGFCCFSMRFVVILDLLSTIVQPVTVAYLVYLFYLIGKDPSNIPITSIILLASIYGLQALIFLLRRRWEMVGWMIMYIIAIPVFSLAIPLYSFWHMDDFSWGTTRVVMGEKGNKLVLSQEGRFDPSEIPLQKWQDYQAEAWEHSDLRSDAESTRTFTTKYSESNLNVATNGRPQSTMTMQSTGIPGRPQSTTMNEEVEMSILNMPSDEEITNEVRNILSTADLMSVTKKSIRTQLENRFGVKLTSKRDYINYVTEAVLTGQL